MLTSTRAILGRLEDVDMLLFSSGAFGGGVRGVGEMYCFTAINPYPNTFGSIPKARIGAHSELISVYGETNQKNMLRGNYRWNSEISVKQFLPTTESSGVGYFVEVRLK